MSTIMDITMLTMIDQLTVFVIAEPIVDKTVESVATSFIHASVCIFDTAVTVLSGNGTESCN